MDQLGIRGNKSQPYPRQQAFGQAAQIDHPSAVIKTLQSRMVAAQKILFVFVVVLNDQQVIFTGTGHQLQASVQRHGHASGRLMAGRAKHHLAVGQLLIDHQPLAINAQRFQRAATQTENIARVHIARILQPHHQPRAAQQPGEHIQRILRADGDHHFLRRHADPAFGQHTLDDLFDQQRVIKHHLIIDPTAHMCASAGDARTVAPAGSGLLIRLDLTIDERVAILTPVARLDDGPQLRRTALQARLPVRCMVGALEDFLRGGFEADIELLAQVLLVDKKTAPVRWDQITILHQLLVHQHHGIARHP